MVPATAERSAVRAGVVHGDGYGVDDGHRAGIGGVGDAQPKLCGTADGIGDQIASRLHVKVLGLVRAVMARCQSFSSCTLLPQDPYMLCHPTVLPLQQSRTLKREEPLT